MSIYTPTPTNTGSFLCGKCCDEVPIKCLPCEPEPDGKVYEYYAVCALCGNEDIEEIEE